MPVTVGRAARRALGARVSAFARTNVLRNVFVVVILFLAINMI